MAYPWFRMYTEFATDPVVQSLSFDDQRHFLVLLCLKGSGVLDKEFENRQVRIDVIRKTLGLDGKAWDETRSRLQAVKLVDHDLHPVNWAKRQLLADVSTDRVRKYRKNKEKQAIDETVSETVSETLSSVSISSSESKREVWREIENLDHTAFEKWLKYRGSIKRQFKSDQTLIAQAKKLAAFGAAQAAVVQQSIDEGWQGLFAIKGDAKPIPTKLWDPESEQMVSTDGMPRWKVEELLKAEARSKAFLSGG
jgi:hypothetical protein